MIKTSSRILLNDGTSVLTEREAAKQLLREGRLKEGCFVEESPQAETFELIFGEKIQKKIEESPYLAEIRPPTFLEKEAVYNKLFKQSRDDTPWNRHSDRVYEEMRYFDRKKMMPVLTMLNRLIERFKRDGVVWGVGRGSAIASYVLYLLEVHDVNPLKYDIPFEECTKCTIDTE